MTLASPRSPGRPELAAARELWAVTVPVRPELLGDVVRAGGGPGSRLWSRSDMSLLGRGEALRLTLPAGWADPAHTSRVAQALRIIVADDPVAEPGSGPVAMGALPYDPGRAGHLVIPRLLAVARAGRAWATLTGPGHLPPSQADARAAVEQELGALQRQVEERSRRQALPDRFELAAHMPHADWKLLVARAVAEMDQGAFTKVVLARRVDVVANRPFVLPETLSRLATLYPSCAVFHIEGFIGASPEVLVRRTGHDVLSHPLAGTVARSGDTGTDAALLAGLMASAKDRHEHQLVVDAIAAKLRPLCLNLEVPPVPSVLALRNVSHLGTELRGALADGAPSSLSLAALLQPTPAVGGQPAEAALAWQRDHEGFDRGTYAGPVGWMDGRGDGEWVLGLRSANVSGCEAALYAGNGIVAASSPDAELAETQLKLQALLAALVRP
jgi:menaquinone-specific isochorismate synthase